MTLTSDQSATLVLTDQLLERLATLDVTAIRLSPDGRATAVGEARWVEHILIAAPIFQASVRQQWPSLMNGGGKVVPIWPGLMLAPLPGPRRKRLSRAEGGKPILAALLPSDELPRSEQLRAVCDSAGLDYQAVLRRIDRASLFSRREAERLAAALAWMFDDISQVDRRMGELQTMSQELAESYEELSLLYKLSANMTLTQSPAGFLAEACADIQQVLGVEWMALQLIEDEPRLEDLVGRLFTAGSVELGDAVWSSGRELIDRFGAVPESTVIDDSASLGISGLSSLVRNMLVVPLRFDGQALGILFGGDKLDGSRLSSIDSKLCDSLANSLTIFLRNMMLYEDMQAMFLGTLHALTAAIDAKDSYTHGHSERVALMSRMLAEAAGLDAKTVERVYISGLVHDVGKIGVPESVLCKPGKLSAEEFDLIKMHPEIGARILQDIRQMSDLVPGVLCHHERWDGRGYPNGLVGEEIPLIGRVIGLADAFDAMSSDRTYRKALELSQVLDEIKNCGGSQFDPELVNVFLQLDFEPFYRLIERHSNGLVRREAG